MNMRLQFLAVLLLIAAATGVSAAAQEKSDASAAGARQALVMGNADYPDDDVPLRHPIKDARALAGELRRAGFEVVVGENLSRQAMQAAIAGFKAKIKPGAAALIFFSGHGIQVGRQSYMIPVNAQIWSETDVRRDAIGIESVLADMDSRGARVKLVIVDASRINPFERRFRGFSAGLASIVAPSSTLIVSATAPGKTSNDGNGENSLFVGELLKEIRSPGKTAEQVFVNTARGVSRASDGRQLPWVSSSLAEDFYFNLPSTAAKPLPSTEALSMPKSPPVDADAEVRRGCPSTEQATTKKAWNEFLAKHPTGPCADLAREQLAKLENAPPAKPPLGYRPADDRALQDVNAAIRRNPNEADGYYQRGQTYAKRGEYDRAIRDFDRVLRLSPKDAEALNNRCWTRAIIGRLQAALRDCNKALALQPNFADAFDSLAFTYLKIGHVRRAIVFYDAALRGNPEQASSLFGRGKAKLKNGDTTGGTADIEAAKAIKPDIAEEFAGYGVR